MKIHRQWLKGSTVMPERQMCPQRYAHHLNFVPNTEITLIIAHQLKDAEPQSGPKRTQNAPK
jgi:hypothetical protein